MPESTCRHCGYRFWPRKAQPKRCARCQKWWPLGEPSEPVRADHAPGYTTEQLRRWTETEAEKKTTAQA